jgi:hypothetical protein
MFSSSDAGFLMLHAKEKPFVASHSTPALSGHQRNLTMK